MGTSDFNSKCKHHYLVKGILQRGTHFFWVGMNAPSASLSPCRARGGKTGRFTENQSLSFDDAAPDTDQQLFSRKAIGLHSGRRLVLSTGEQAPLSSGVLPVCNDADDDDLGCESAQNQCM